MNRRTSIKLIEQAAAEGWIKQLAFFHMLKFTFNNSCLYDYKSRMPELAGQFNVCTKTFYTYLNILRSKELVYEHSNNLVLKSLKGGRVKTTLIVTADHSLFDITCLLYAKLIEKKARQMAFMESLRRSGRGDKFKVGLCETPFRPSLSFRTIAKLLNVSEYKAFNVTKNLVKSGVINCEKPKPVFLAGNFTALETVEDMPGRRFNIDGRLFEIFGQKIDFLQFPVYLRRFSYKQLKMIFKCNTTLKLL